MTQKFFDYGVDSEIKLFLGETGGQSDQWIRIHESVLPPFRCSEEHEWDVDVHPRMRCQKSGDQMDLVFDDILRARVSGNSLKVLVDRSSTDDYAVAHLILDQLLPRVLGQQGELILHGGAVARDGQALVFLGRSGAGKSTLCAAFLQDGWQVLSDDCVRIRSNPSTVEGSYPGLRLHDDSLHSVMDASAGMGAMAGYSEKQRVSIDQPDVKAPMLGAIVLLDSAHQEVSMEQLSGSAATLAILQESFTLWPGDSDCAAGKLMQVSALIEQGTSVFRCGFRHHFDQLPELKRQISGLL